MNETNSEPPTSNAEHRTWGDAALRMTNDEFPMTKEIRNPNDEGKTRGRARTGSTFVLRHPIGIRHSGFDIFQSHEPIYELRFTRANRRSRQMSSRAFPSLSNRQS
ncbi:MAG: hypothetical protein DME19_13460 [Verrucomicrobia bacterium]|nr:MAG: hypothetical protein DME19_13460 [Verrucomicrobiota bacterium]